MTKFEDVLETILEEYARRDSEGEFDTWEETDAFVKEKAEVLLAYAKEPISEDLKEAMQHNAPNNIGIDDLLYWRNGFIAGVKWKEELFEKNRIAACDKQTEEEAEREYDFVMGIIENEHRQPTFDDAIKCGMKKMKEQMMAKAIDGEVGYWNLRGLSVNVKLPRSVGEGDKVKVLVVKED